MSDKRWIKIEDSKPEDSTWVIVTALSPENNWITTMAFYCVNDKGETSWLSHNDGSLECGEWEDVSAWMPLPEHYQSI